MVDDLARDLGRSVERPLGGLDPGLRRVRYTEGELHRAEPKCMIRLSAPLPSPSARKLMLNARTASISGQGHRAVDKVRRRDQRPCTKPSELLEHAEHHPMVPIVERDHGHPLRTSDLSPTLDQLVVAMPAPERGGHRACWPPQFHLKPVIGSDSHAALDVLLPLRGQDLRQRAQRDDDMHPGRIEIVDHPPDGIRLRVREELAAEHDTGRRAFRMSRRRRCQRAMDGDPVSLKNEGRPVAARTALPEWRAEPA